MAKMMPPKTPMAAASLGVAKPNKIEPKTDMIKTAKGTKAFNTMTMLSQTLYWSTSLGFGHKEGLSVARMMMYTRYRKANVKPGMMAAAYILTTETLAVAA